MRNVLTFTGVWFLLAIILQSAGVGLAVGAVVASTFALLVTALTWSR